MACRAITMTLAAVALSCVVACGEPSPRAAAPEGSAAAAVSGQGTSTMVGAPLTSNDVCGLLGQEEVRAIIGESAAPAPKAMPAHPGVSEGRCVWDPGGGKSEMSLSVMQSSDPTMAQLVTQMPFAGEAIAGLGDRAAIETQGTYSVEVGVLVSGRRLALTVSGLGVVARKDAAVAAARVAASKLR